MRVSLLVILALGVTLGTPASASEQSLMDTARSLSKLSSTYSKGRCSLGSSGLFGGSSGCRTIAKKSAPKLFTASSGGSNPWGTSLFGTTGFGRTSFGTTRFGTNTPFGRSNGFGRTSFGKTVFGRFR